MFRDEVLGWAATVGPGVVWTLALQFAVMLLAVCLACWNDVDNE